ncbi:MAG: dimethylsulfoxide reductase subunit B [Burkholderiaceae bacterium]|jgi:anaerobic dimethyl sulfoxide reductase subunit B (iron-sulfur subunit)|nr:dimethylsulfoxide reductase subunit B [Burkholderiaceae bacterium]
MTQLGFYVDVAKCTGCKTCQVACKDKNGLPVGINFRRVAEYAGGQWKQLEPGVWQQDVFAYYTSISCNHCADPACVTVCPTGAHAKRKEDGLVLIDSAQCIGCKRCAKACPYGAPQYNPATQKMMKCDGCVDRLAQGQNPTCVDACPQRAIEFGDIEQLRRKYGKGAAIAPLPDPKRTRPSLVIKAPRNARPVGDTRGSVQV